jgi:hypothetical protein
VQQRGSGEYVDAGGRSREQCELGGVEKRRDIEVVGRLRDGATGVAVDAPGPGAGLVDQVDGSIQRRVTHTAAVGSPDKRRGCPPKHVFPPQCAAQVTEQAHDAQQGEGEEQDRATQDDGRDGHLVADRVRQHEDG